MPRKMNNEDWNNLGYQGRYLNLKEGDNVEVVFLTGFWYFDKGEEDFFGRVNKYGGWKAKVRLVGMTDEKILSGQTGLRKKLKEIFEKNKLSPDILDKDKPIFYLERLNKYDWDVEFKGYADDDITNQDSVGQSLESKVNKIMLDILKDGSVKKVFMKNLVKVKLNDDSVKIGDIEKVISDILKNDPRFVENNNEISLRYTDEDIINNIKTLVVANGKMADKNDIFDIVVKDYGISKDKFEELIKLGGFDYDGNTIYC